MKLSSSISGIDVVVLAFDAASNKVLEAWGRRILRPSGTTRSIKSESRRRAHWAGRSALAWGLAQRGEKGYVAPHPFGYLQYFDPAGELREDLYVNISHTDSLAVAALAPCPIGIDIESSTRDASKALTRVATETEREAIEKRVLTIEGVQVPSGIAVWSAKEAASKAVGLGMKFGLHQFEIQLEGAAPHLVRQKIEGPLKLTTPAVTFGLWEGYVISLCAEREVLLRGARRSVVSLSDLSV